jgi:hypothetical protein
MEIMAATSFLSTVLTVNLLRFLTVPMKQNNAVLFLGFFVSF